MSLLDPRWNGEGEGQPRAYAVQGDVIYFFPTPDAVYSIRHLHYGADDDFQEDQENNWLKHFPDLLIAEVGHMMAARYIKNAEAQQLFSMDLQRESQRLMRATIAREWADSDPTPID